MNDVPQMTPRLQDALERCRNPEPMTDPTTGELVYAPLDKLCILVYNKSIAELEADGAEANELLTLSNLI